MTPTSSSAARPHLTFDPEEIYAARADGLAHSIFPPTAAPTGHGEGRGRWPLVASRESLPSRIASTALARDRSVIESETACTTRPSAPLSSRASQVAERALSGRSRGARQLRAALRAINAANMGQRASSRAHLEDSQRRKEPSALSLSPKSERMPPGALLSRAESGESAMPILGAKRPRESTTDAIPPMALPTAPKVSRRQSNHPVAPVDYRSLRIRIPDLPLEAFPSAVVGRPDNLHSNRDAALRFGDEISVRWEASGASSPLRSIAGAFRDLTRVPLNPTLIHIRALYAHFCELRSRDLPLASLEAIRDDLARMRLFVPILQRDSRFYAAVTDAIGMLQFTLDLSRTQRRIAGVKPFTTLHGLPEAREMVEIIDKLDTLVRRPLSSGGWGYVTILEEHPTILEKKYRDSRHENLSDAMRWREAALPSLFPRGSGLGEGILSFSSHRVFLKRVMGKELVDWLNALPEESSTPFEYIVKWTRSMANTLQTLKEHGSVWWDVKAENMVVDEHGDLFLVDPGNASFHREMQTTGSGTVEIMAPEFAENARTRAAARQTVEADSWALGCLLYVLAVHKNLTDFCSIYEGCPELLKDPRYVLEFIATPRGHRSLMEHIDQLPRLFSHTGYRAEEWTWMTRLLKGLLVRNPSERTTPAQVLEMAPPIITEE